ncbi:hypothetical protein BaRGS_00029747, partial [Batillaria attramentaria]
RKYHVKGRGNAGKCRKSGRRERNDKHRPNPTWNLGFVDAKGAEEEQRDLSSVKVDLRAVFGGICEESWSAGIAFWQAWQ